MQRFIVWLVVAIMAMPGQAATAYHYIVANTPELRQQGLMHRKIDPKTGLLFVFPQSRRPAFWMRNTPQDLWLAFFNAHGRIVETTAMKAYTDVRHEARHQVIMALEVLDTPNHRRIFSAGRTIAYVKNHAQQLVKQAR